MSDKRIYFFGIKESDGSASMIDILGGKGANLSEMCNIGLPVPPGFIIPCQECILFLKNGLVLEESLKKKIVEYVSIVEKYLNDGRFFGNEINPLLFSVRSGSFVSMPGMMDTVLNLGLNNKTVIALAKKTNNLRFALDSYRRFIQMYSNIVLGIDGSFFEYVLSSYKKSVGILYDTDIDIDGMNYLIIEYKNIVLKKTNKEFPQDVFEQLFCAIIAVFKSWNSDRAVYYRKIHGISEKLGTAVTVQVMVFGNTGFNSATGVVFTRNPSTGENRLYGEYLLNAQGEDVVAGIRTPKNIRDLEKDMPSVYLECKKIFKKLELHYKASQDIEFTIENNKLWILQTRNAKTTAFASIKIAVDMVFENILSKKEAILSIDTKILEQLLHKTISNVQDLKIIGSGIAASPGATKGVIAMSCIAVTDFKKKGISSILVRNETSAEDIEGMDIASGILTTTGGATSHAAVIARGMGKVCVVGANDVIINISKKHCVFNDNLILKEGNEIIIDGSSGKIFIGNAEFEESAMFKEFTDFMSWVDEFRKTKIRVNADTEQDVVTALSFKVDGIGLCRTEHMFFNKDRIFNIRKMILSNNKEDKMIAISELFNYQVNDFKKIFNILNGLPINIRLLDPPLHEFLPKTEYDIEALSIGIGCNIDDVKEMIHKLEEINPMLGNRGCRLGIMYPEIYDMQVEAIFTATKECGCETNIEIMVPFVTERKELEYLKERLLLISSRFSSIKYKIGTMIETPRAAILSYMLADLVDYFSFGTNDLTQMTFGISRDDSFSFLSKYQEIGIFDKNPFVSIDEFCVGNLIKMSISKGKSVNKHLTVGICGEHGGDPESIHFFVKNNFDYISCSPYRVLIAKLATVQAEMIN